MYFLERKQFESIPVSSTVANGMHMVKEFLLDDFFYYGDHRGFYQSDKNIFLYIIDTKERVISSLKMDADGSIYRFQQKLKSKLEGRKFSFRSLPLVGILNIYRVTRVKISFLLIPGCPRYKMILPPVTIHPLTGHSVEGPIQIATSISYFAFSLTLRPKHGVFLKESKSKQDWQNKTEFLLLIFQIKAQGDGYKVEEICRDSIKDYISKGGKVEQLLFNEQQDVILLHAINRTDYSEGKLGCFLIYDINCRIITQKLGVDETQDMFFGLYFLHQPSSEEDLIFAHSISSDMNVFVRSKNHDLKFLTSLKTNHVFDDSSCAKYWLNNNTCFKNWNNQFLLFLLDKTDTLTVYDIFGKSNAAIIPCRRRPRYCCTISSYFGTKINFNKTGEEIYIWDDVKLRVYVYKPFPKSLAYLCGLAVSKTFSSFQLKEMNLPKYLYKYISSNTRCL